MRDHEVMDSPVDLLHAFLSRLIRCGDEIGSTVSLLNLSPGSFSEHRLPTVSLSRLWLHGLSHAEQLKSVDGERM